MREAFAESFADWSDWNVLGYLEQVQRRGVPVLVVNWPVLHAARDDCYNPLYPEAAYRENLAWLEAETARRGLAHLDLHDLLPAQAFRDPMHLGPEGQEPIAERIAAAVQTALGPPAGSDSGKRAADAGSAGRVAGR